MYVCMYVCVCLRGGHTVRQGQSRQTGWLAGWLALVLIDLVCCTYVYIYRLVDNMWCFKKEKSVKEGGKNKSLTKELGLF